MDVDLDRYRELSNAPEAIADRRAALLDQLGWLADEAAALAPFLAALPAWAVDVAPLPGDRSVRETLAHLARLDREVHMGWIERLEAEARPALEPAHEAPEPEERGETPDLDALVADLRRARAALLGRVEALPAAVWEREATLGGAPITLYDLLLRVVRHDADLLRALAYRLHEAKLTDRPQDLPK